MFMANVQILWQNQEHYFKYLSSVELAIKSSSAVPWDPVHPSHVVLSGRRENWHWTDGLAEHQSVLQKPCWLCWFKELIILHLLKSKQVIPLMRRGKREAEDGRTSGYQHWCWLPHTTGTAPLSSPSSVHRLCIECLCEGGFDLLNEPDLFAVV